MKLALDWQLSSYFGWGVYGLNLALEWSGDPSIEARSVLPVQMGNIALDPLRRRALKGFVGRSHQPFPDDAVVLHALGNDLVGHQSQAARIAVIFFEHELSRAAIEKAKRYDLIITGSSWNEQLLREAGVHNVTTILQGIDPTLFHPAPRRGLFADRFVIFSGGKAEPRKGQDLVVKAFRIFAERHPDAMLVTAWHSPWPQLAAGMDLDLREFGDRVIDVGAVPNAMMAPIYRECDVGLFPNRAEGGTNLVAMECIACGVPTILSNNTGHRDLIGRAGVRPLRQSPGATWSEWGESDVDDIVAVLESARTWSRQLRNPIEDLTWSRTARALKSTVEKVYGQSSTRNVA